MDIITGMADTDTEVMDMVATGMAVLSSSRLGQSSSNRPSLFRQPTDMAGAIPVVDTATVLTVMDRD